MSHIDTITEEVKPSSLLSVEKKEEINLEDIIFFFNTNSDEYSVSLKAGRVYQTNKKLNLINTLFKMLQEEVEKIDSKNNKDLDKSFFNLNKKIPINSSHFQFLRMIGAFWQLVLLYY